jgi:2-keto-4-pentenoate hydratase/2-oxohepta-3-ene-1,7-dioic acid hydratase in catechol pathway
MKGDHTIIGPDEPIRLPPRSQRVTAEAELGLITMDEVLERFATVDEIVVAAVNNDHLHHQSVVADMAFRPAELVSFHSHVMPLFPGDIISTGHLVPW